MSFSSNDLILGDGKQLSSVSVACPIEKLHSDGLVEAFIAIGSWEDNGILLCKKPERQGVTPT